MKQSFSVTSAALAVLTFACSVMPAAAEHHEGFTNDFAADLQRVGNRLVQLAEAVPADQFGWAPAEGVRTVSQVYMHVVGTNMLMPMALGAPAPEGLEIPEQGPFALMGQWEKDVTSKDDVIAKLKASVEYAVEAVKQIPGHDEQVELFGFPGSKRAYMLILLTHAHEHLGQSIAYARSLGVVPPWSRAAEE